MNKDQLIRSTPWDTAAFGMPTWELREYSAAALDLAKTEELIFPDMEMLLERAVVGLLGGHVEPLEQPAEQHDPQSGFDGQDDDDGH